MSKKSPGLTLLDIGAPTEEVQIGTRGAVTVHGLSAENMVELFQRFPDAMKWITPGNVDLARMTTAGPKLITAVIAYATGSPNSEEAEAVAGNLSIELQLDILEAVFRLSFKDGFGPFVARIAALSGEAESANFGRVTATNSQPESKPSLPTDTTPSPSGD